jgi:hypothetical protein
MLLINKDWLKKLRQLQMKIKIRSLRIKYSNPPECRYPIVMTVTNNSPMTGEWTGYVQLCS